TAFENDANDAERSADALDVEAVGTIPFRNDRADGIGQFGNGLDRFDDAVDAGIGQQQSIEEGAGNALFLGCGHVEFVGGKDFLAMRINGTRGGQQGRALLFRRRDLEGASADTGVAANLAHDFGYGLGGLYSTHAVVSSIVP